jgi:hypothetical protein
MPPKQSRIEGGKRAILTMIDTVFATVQEQNIEVLLWEGSNRNVLQRHKVILTNTIIDSDFFMKEVSDYFAPYKCANSYVECKSCGINDNPGSLYYGKFVANFDVKYFKDHIPYPSADSVQQLRSMLEITEAQLINATTENKRLIKKNNKVIAKTKQYMKNMLKLVTEMYSSGHCNRDCPTCWETIATDKVYVSGCGHFLCLDCKDKLTKPECPMCREPLLAL